MNLQDMSMFPSKGNRKIAAFCYALVFYIVGCIATGGQVDGYTVTALFGLFVGGNYGEHRSDGRPDKT